MSGVRMLPRLCEESSPNASPAAKGTDTDDLAAGDVIYTNDPIQPASSVMPDLQCFWEAFPSGSGARDRTTYMFTYVDAQPTRPSLLAMMEEYWKLMPKYQVTFPYTMPEAMVATCVAGCPIRLLVPKRCKPV